MMMLVVVLNATKKGAPKGVGGGPEGHCRRFWLQDPCTDYRQTDREIRRGIRSVPLINGWMDDLQT